VTYANAGAAGNSNTIARTSITYPYNTGSRLVTFNYNSGDDSALNRVSSLSFAGDTVASWNYFGLSSVAETQYDAATINSTLANGSLYPGLDLFGRIVNLPWTQSTTGDLAQLNYGYDQASNRVYRQDAKAGTNFDELYSYDGMHRLQSAARGTLTSGVPPITNPTLQQGWHLDATGNWVGFNNFDLVTASNSWMQQRASNAANEITGMAATVGPTWQTPAYDRNGNMTTIPQPLALTEGYTGVWDAWNRLIYLQSGDENVEFCLYDGLNRRVMRNQYSGVTLAESRFFIHSDQWQVLEEYVAATSLTVPVVQWVWGIRYIDDCVLRDSDSSGTLNLRLYALQDANWNVVAVYNPASGGSIVERYAYTAYGVVQFLNASFEPLSGNVSAYSWETLYCGYRYDAAVGLFLARNRWLHPLLGCWLSSDPAAGMRRYQYAANTPPNTRDPNGLCSEGYEVCEAPTDCKCTSLEIISVGLSTSLADIKTQQTGRKWFGTAYGVVYHATGTGDVNQCSFKRLKKDTVWTTVLGKQVFDPKENDQSFVPDGPDVERDPKGNVQSPQFRVNQQAGTWDRFDLDFPGYFIEQAGLPMQKLADYEYYVVNSNGNITIKCDREWYLTLDIDANGTSTVKPLPVGTMQQPRPIGREVPVTD
jgi:RHS repeat-associated protein